VSVDMHIETRLVHHDKGTQAGAGEAIFRKYLNACITHGASDLHLKVDSPPKIRVRGDLRPLEAPAMERDLCFQIVRDILDAGQYNVFVRRGQLDIAYEYDDDCRFRVNVFMSRGRVSFACRLITADVKSFKDLYIPEILGEVAMAANGLILFAGVTGSGKSTSIAAMLQHVNEHKRCHIVTIEDPIEYIFNEVKSTINQREVGIDCLSFDEALRALVREDPDVVLVGEMRDKETFEAAIRASETGHLVFGTIHASSAWQTFGRIYDLFDEGEVPQIRKLLAYNVRAIVYQKLLKTLRKDVPRVPAVEILLGTPIVQKYVFEAREGELLEVIRKSTQEGMIDFTQSLVNLVESEFIHHRVALDATPRPEELKMRLKGIS
jgi:twitching motility protein PilT